MRRDWLIYALLLIAVVLLILGAYYAEQITPWIERLTKPDQGILP